jgi:hypothetical protein
MQHGHLISHLTLKITVGGDRQKLREFSEAAARCRSVELTLLHPPGQVVDLADLKAVAGCLCCFTCRPTSSGRGSLIGTSVFSSMSQLTALDVDREQFGSEEPWGMLAKLTSLQQLEFLEVSATGDPSPLSALTGLKLLDLHSIEHAADGPAPFSFSSLQPLSALQQLEVLHLWDHACAATSLQGLAGLSKLEKLALGGAESCGKLQSLEGISPGVKELCLLNDPDLASLAGIEGCTRLEKITLEHCGVNSMQPLRGLSSIKELNLSGYCLTSLESLHNMPLQSLSLTGCDALTQLSGMEHLSALTRLDVMMCMNVDSLQPLSELGAGLQELMVFKCGRVQEEVLELPHVQPTADVVVDGSNVKEVVLAGGLRRAVRPL